MLNLDSPETGRATPILAARTSAGDAKSKGNDADENTDFAHIWLEHEQSAKELKAGESEPTFLPNHPSSTAPQEEVALSETPAPHRNPDASTDDPASGPKPVHSATSEISGVLPGVAGSASEGRAPQDRMDPRQAQSENMPNPAIRGGQSTGIDPVPPKNGTISNPSKRQSNADAPDTVTRTGERPVLESPQSVTVTVPRPRDPVSSAFALQAVPVQQGPKLSSTSDVPHLSTRRNGAPSTSGTGATLTPQTPPLTSPAVASFLAHQSNQPALEIGGLTEIEPLMMGAPNTSTTQINPQSAAPSTTNYAPQVASQLAATAIQSGPGTTQIALNPEELGRVRMTLRTTEHGITVAITAERPETMDLMRRNIDLLIKEFEDLGQGSVAFSFGENSPNSGETESESPTLDLTDQADLGLEPAPTHIRPAAQSGGLDLKL